MAESKPLWRRVFDRVDGTVAPVLERGVQTSAFARTVGLLTRAQADYRRVVERQTRQWWHAMNLPAGTDVRRLREQIVDLDREVRQLRNAVEDRRRAR